MDLLFKITAGSPATPPHVGDTNFLDPYTGANRSLACAEIPPGIRQATEKFVLPYIGTELYDNLAAKYQTNTALTNEQAKVLELLQDCIAFYTAYHVLPERNAFLASMGVIQNTPTEGSAQPVNQWGW